MGRRPDDVDTAAAIAQYAGFLGTLVEQYEPTAWAEELIEPARAVQHRSLAILYAIAAQCCWIGQIDKAVRHSENGQRLISDESFDRFPFGYGASLGVPYIAVGQPKRWADLARTLLEYDDDRHTNIRTALAYALTIAGAYDEAMAATDGLIAAAEATRNPHALANALLAYGFAFRYADPPAALTAHRQALEIAQESGNRFVESHIAVSLSQVEVQEDAPQAAFDHLALAIRNYLDTGNLATSRSPLAILAGLLDRLGHREPAATVADFAANPLTHLAFPEITATIAHLREVLGDDRYESLAQAGQAMTNAAMAAYALEQIDLARAPAQFSDNADLSTSSGRPPRSRARRWNSFNDSPRPSASSRSPCQMRCPTAYDGACPGQPR